MTGEYAFTQGETVVLGVPVPMGEYVGTLLSPSHARTDLGELTLGSGGEVDITFVAAEHGVYEYRVESDDLAVEGSIYVSPSSILSSGS